MGLQSHPKEQPGLWEKANIIGELLLLLATSCQHLNKIAFGTRLFKHAVDMKVLTNHSSMLTKSGICSLKISLKYFQILCLALVVSADICSFGASDLALEPWSFENRAVTCTKDSYVGNVVFHIHKNSKRGSFNSSQS